MANKILKLGDKYVTFGGASSTEEAYLAQFGQKPQKTLSETTASEATADIPYWNKLAANGIEREEDIPRDFAMLVEMKGIGPKAAKAILRYLEAEG